MNNEAFTECLDDILDSIGEVLSVKSKEYSLYGDRLHSFKQGSKVCGLDPKVYLFALMTKHIQCVKDLCHGELPNYESLVEEKIRDSINYLILLEALMKEERRST